MSPLDWIAFLLTMLVFAIQPGTECAFVRSDNGALMTPWCERYTFEGCRQTMAGVYVYPDPGLTRSASWYWMGVEP